MSEVIVLTVYFASLCLCVCGVCNRNNCTLFLDGSMWIVLALPFHCTHVKIMHWFIIQCAFIAIVDLRSSQNVLWGYSKPQRIGTGATATATVWKNDCTGTIGIALHWIATDGISIYVKQKHKIETHEKYTKKTDGTHKSENGLYNNEIYTKIKPKKEEKNEPTQQIHCSTFTTNMYNRYNYLLTLMCTAWRSCQCQTCDHLLIAVKHSVQIENGKFSDS